MGFLNNIFITLLINKFNVFSNYAEFRISVANVSEELSDFLHFHRDIIDEKISGTLGVAKVVNCLSPNTKPNILINSTLCFYGCYYFKNETLCHNTISVNNISKTTYTFMNQVPFSENLFQFLKMQFVSKILILIIVVLAEDEQI